MKHQIIDLETCRSNESISRHTYMSNRLFIAYMSNRLLIVRT